MVTSPNIGNLSSDSNIGNFLALPNASYPYFWAWILGSMWLIISMTLYFKEKQTLGKGKLLSSMSVAAFAILVLSTIGTVLTIISLEIMVYIFIFSMLIIGVWFFTGR